MDPHENFKKDCLERAKKQSSDETLKQLSNNFLKRSCDFLYSYNFTWLGRPIIQYPQDMAAVQEIVYSTKPDLIIETGIAHGGSLIYSASLLCMLDLMDGLNPKNSKRMVIGIDIEIRPHNLKAIKEHPLSYKIKLIEGSSTSDQVTKQVREISENYDSTMVMLDSNHTEDHVFKELKAYANLTSIGNYCIVFDTDIEFLPKNYFNERNWDVGNNPHTALEKWLEDNKNFTRDRSVDEKLMITVAPGGYLIRES